MQLTQVLICNVKQTKGFIITDQIMRGFMNTNPIYPLRIIIHQGLRNFRKTQNIFSVEPYPD